MNGEHGHGEASAAISNGLMHLHMEFYGRGPTRAKTLFVDDTVVCMLWDGFTKVEQTLIERDQTAAVETFRRTFQIAMEAQFIGVVEGATERKVMAYMSQVHVDPNIAVEFFLLEPAASGD
jgi:uncharacterized protein YbcI